MPRVVLFEWTAGGHRPIYVRRLVVSGQSGGYARLTNTPGIWDANRGLYARRGGGTPLGPSAWGQSPMVARTSRSPLAPEQRASQRDGCVLYGALAARKGLDLLARALTLEPTQLRLVLASEPADSYMPELEHHAAAMRERGVDVDLRPYRLSEIDGLKVLAGGNCAVLPDPYHAGMSRVLVGRHTRRGTRLLGHLVRTHGLGLSGLHRPTRVTGGRSEDG